MSRIRILPPTLFLLSVAAMVALHLIWPGTLLRWHSPYHVMPMVLLVGGLSLAMWGSHHFNKVGTNIETFQEPGKLVTDGPFRFSRNPMYLGMVIALLGIAKALNSASPLLVVLAFFFITDRWYIRYEEARMREKFGSGYDAYRAHTRRWI